MLFRSRSIQLMHALTKMGIPIATEYVGAIGIQYYNHMVSYSVIGARTCESQLHRQIGSGMSMPMGVKNSSSGDVEAAVNACKFIAKPSVFIGIDSNNEVCTVKTKGNHSTSVILRGSYKNGENYSDVKTNLEESKGMSLIVDCNHGNSGKTVEGCIACFEFIRDLLRDGTYKEIGRAHV